MSNAMLVITRIYTATGFILSKTNARNMESQQAEIKRLETLLRKILPVLQQVEWQK